MPLVYAISDIHGCLQPFEKTLNLIDLKNEEDILILCGDYIDYGTQSCEVLYKVKELTNIYPNQVIALLGNHEDMFLKFLSSSKFDVWNLEWLGADRDLSTVFSFMSEPVKISVWNMLKEIYYPDTYFEIARIVKEDILQNHSTLISWIKNLPLYYETETQIFVHAGIDEEAEDYWQYETSKDCFLSKYPATFGKFYKDIIAGHVNTSSLEKVNNFHNIFWDGNNHFYLDGDTDNSSIVPVLKYNTVTRKYSSFKIQTDEAGHEIFEEYYVSELGSGV